MLKLFVTSLALWDRTFRFSGSISTLKQKRQVMSEMRERFGDSTLLASVVVASGAFTTYSPHP